MAHNEERTVWWKEALMGALAGFQYGLVQISVGHPFDTLKTKMQVQEEFKQLNYRNSIVKVYQQDGIKGFYRGASSIALGCSFFRSAQLMSFEAIHSRFDKKNLKGKGYEKIFTYVIPNTMGLEVRTIAAGFGSGVFRSLVETPFEFIKVRKQVKYNYKFIELYHGLIPLMMKNSFTLALGFSFIDSFRRNTNAWNSSLGVFLASGFSTVACHIITWPIEVFRNTYMASSKNEKINKVLQDKIKTYGFFRGIFRGALPGLTSTFVRNGVAFALLQKLQKLMTYLGFREQKPVKKH